MNKALPGRDPKNAVAFKKSCLLLLFFAALSHYAMAIGFLLPNQDATAIGRGNAFTATADNPSAIYYNPAGISQLPGLNIQLGELNYLGINTYYHSTAGANTTSYFHIIPVPQMYLTYAPTNLPLTFGLGVYSPFGLGVDWPANSGIRSLAIQSKLTYLTVNPVISWQVVKSLSVAVGPTFNYAQVEFSRGLFTQNDYFDFSGDGFSYGLTAGALWHPLDQLSFGVNYRLASTTDFRGSSAYVPAPGAPSESAGTSANVPFPQTVTLGISYRPTSKWNLEADVDYINWSPLQTVGLSGTHNLPFIGQALGGSDLPLSLNWHDSWQYKFGVTRYLENGWFVSAGYFFSTDTASAANFTPAIPDTSLHVGSLGFGRDGEHWSWAVAGQIIAGAARAIAEIPNSQVGGGTYRLFVPALSVSAGYHF
jgi:long-chain fatty acid transport protein